MTTQNDIRGWFREGVELGASHLIVVCDSFDHEDYPVYVKRVPETQSETPTEKYERVKRVHSVLNFVHQNYNGQNMQRMMEVYRLSDPMEEQIAEKRSYRYD